MRIHRRLLDVLRKELNSTTENRTGTSLDADKSHIYFNFTDVCRMKQERGPQVRDEDCTPNLVKYVKETQHLGDLSRYSNICGKLCLWTGIM